MTRYTSKTLGACLLIALTASCRATSKSASSSSSGFSQPSYTQQWFNKVRSNMAAAYNSAPPPVLPIVGLELRTGGGRKTVADISFYVDRNGVVGSFTTSGEGMTSLLQFESGGTTIDLPLSASQIAQINAAPDRTLVKLTDLNVSPIDSQTEFCGCISTVVFDYLSAQIFFEGIPGSLTYRHE